VISGYILVIRPFPIFPICSCSCIITVSASSTPFLATAVSRSTWSLIHFFLSWFLKTYVCCLFSAASFLVDHMLRNVPNPRTLSASNPLWPILTWWRAPVEIVLATSQDKQVAVRVLTGGLVWYGPTTSQKPDTLCHGGVVTWTGHNRALFWLGGNRTLVPLCRTYYFWQTLAPIKYFSSDHIVTWSIYTLSSCSRPPTSRFQIYNPTDICWISMIFG